jgi:hypothetical protein
VAAIQEQGDVEPMMQTFINCLLASADYDSFYKVMAKQGNQRVLKKSLNAQLLRRADSKGEEYCASDEKPSHKGESKAESK